MGRADRIYARLVPPRLRNVLLERLFFPAGDLVMGTSMMKQLRYHREISRSSEAELVDLQTQKLARILDHATARSPYYRELGVRRTSDPRADLATFPLLTKPLLRQHTDRLLTRDKEQCIKYATSGSSGVQTDVYLDKAEEANCRAILIHWWEWTGFYLGKPILQAGITPDRGVVKTIKDFLTHTIYVNAFLGDEDEFIRALRMIEGKKHYQLGGYPSSLYLMSLTAMKHGIDVQFDGAICWGDKLFDHYAKSIETAFGCKVYENYGMNEGIMIGQKADLPYFYVYTPSVVVEILDGNGKPVRDGEIGHVVVTKLDGFVMPMIRYVTGDLGVMLPREKYPAQRKLGFPLMERVIGRDTDIVRTPEGGQLVVHTFTGIFEFFPAIRQFKVIQRDTESIEIEYVRDATFSIEVLTEVERVIHTRAKTQIQIHWKAVEEIAPSRSGKPQIIESHLAINKLMMTGPGVS